MALVVLLLLVSVLDSVKASDNRFVMKGSDLLLDGNKAAVGKDEDFIWRFNNTVNVVKFNSGSEPKIHKVYNGRADFLKQNYTLLLKNVQHSDSGNYKAVASGGNEKTVAYYTIRVQDPVSPVNLTVTPADSECLNFTATCTTVDSLISGTFQCDNKTCHLLNRPELKDSFLKVYKEGSSIICNHSNHVSWKNYKQPVTSLCENKTVLNAATIPGISAGVLFFVLVFVMVVIFCKRKKSTYTVYDIPQENPEHNPYESPSDVPSMSPTSTYALVQFKNPPEQHDHHNTSQTKQPETIYAKVEKPAKSTSQQATANR